MCFRVSNIATCLQGRVLQGRLRRRQVDLPSWITSSLHHPVGWGGPWWLQPSVGWHASCSLDLTSAKLSYAHDVRFMSACFPVTLKALVWFLVLKNDENLFQERALVATKTTTSMVLALRLSRWEDSKGRPWSVTLARCSSVPDGVKVAMAQSNVHADKYCRQTYRNTNDMELAQYAHRTR